MERLVRLAQPPWRTVAEDPDVWQAEAPLAVAAPHLSDIRELLSQDLLSLITVRSGSEILAQVTQSNIQLTGEAERRIEALPLPFGDPARECGEAICLPTLSPAERDQILLRLMPMLANPGERPIIRVEIQHKRLVLTRFCPQAKETGLLLWLDPDRLHTWLDGLPPLAQLELFGGPAPLAVTVPDPVVALTGYTFGHIPLASLRTGEWRDRYQEQARSLAARIQELPGTGAPVLVPGLFDFTQIHAFSPQVARAACYALITSLADLLTRVDGATVRVRIPGQTKETEGDLKFSAGALSIGGTDVSLSPEMLTGLLGLVQKRENQIRESKAYRDVWTAALEVALEGDLARLVTHLDQVIKRFDSLRDKLLKTNLEKLTGALEKAQGALNQVSTQINKDVDSIAADLEKAILSTLTAGVITLVGAVVKAGPLDAVGPVIGALVLYTYIPFLLHRLSYFDETIGRKKADFTDALRAMDRTTGGLLQHEKLLARFADYEAAAKKQAGVSLAWVQGLSAGLCVLTTIGGCLAMKPGAVPWLAVAPISAIYALWRRREWRSARWSGVVVWGGLLVLGARAAIVYLPGLDISFLFRGLEWLIRGAAEAIW